MFRAEAALGAFAEGVCARGKTVKTRSAIPTDVASADTRRNSRKREFAWRREYIQYLEVEPTVLLYYRWHTSGRAPATMESSKMP